MFRHLFRLWIASGLCLVGSAAVAEDTKPSVPVVSIEVVIAEFSGGAKQDDGEKSQAVENPTERLKLLERQGRVGSVARIRLSTLDQLPASVQIGERTPIVTARTRAPGGFGERAGGGGGMSSSFTMQNLGTLVNVTPRVEGNGAVVVTLEIERSRLVPPAPVAEGAAAEDGIPRTVSVSAKTTVRVPSGQTVMVTGAKTTAKEESGELLMMVSARLIDAPHAK